MESLIWLGDVDAAHHPLADGLRAHVVRAGREPEQPVLTAIVTEDRLRNREGAPAVAIQDEFRDVRARREAQRR